MKRVFLFLIPLLFARCANQIPPKGGEKDTEPPKLLDALPPEQSTGFTARTIELTFDELIQLKSPNQQIIISPEITPEPTFKVRGKKLTIGLPETLSANTTYSIQFGDALVDYRESNPFSGFEYVFSTGAFIDSLTLSGDVISGKDGQPREGLWVMLHRNLEDSSFQKNRPTYISKTDKSGKFELKNIKSGTYRAYALKDENFNYLFDQPNEEIAFIEEPISITSNVSAVALRSFVDEPEQQILDIAQLETGATLITTARAIQQVKIDGPGIGNNDPAYLNGKKDSLFLWPTVNTDQPIFVEIDNQVYDTLTIDLDPDSSRMAWKGKRSRTIKNIHKSLIIKSLQPFSSVKHEAVVLVRHVDSVEVDHEINISKTRPFEFSVSAEWENNTKYSLHFPSNSVFNHYGQSLPERTFELTTTGSTSDGTIEIEYNTDRPFYLLQLSMSGKIIYEDWLDPEKQSLRINHLSAGSYTATLILDLNGNRIWDTGSFQEKRQPEKIISGQPVELKSGWEQIITFQLSN